MALERVREWLRKRREQQAAGGPDAGAGEQRRPAGTFVPPPSAPGGSANPRHFGDLWEALQEVAREEAPERFATGTVSEHAAESVEGKKDVERWLHIVRRRADPTHVYRFPAHHRRHRGYCLIPRHWPSGTTWEAFDEETLTRARVPAERDPDALIAALDAWLGARD